MTQDSFKIRFTGAAQKKRNQAFCRTEDNWEVRMVNGVTLRDRLGPRLHCCCLRWKQLRGRTDGQRGFVLCRTCSVEEKIKSSSLSFTNDHKILIYSNDLFIHPCFYIALWAQYNKHGFQWFVHTLLFLYCLLGSIVFRYCCTRSLLAT